MQSSRMQNGVQQLQEAADTFSLARPESANDREDSQIKYSKRTELMMHKIGSARAGHKQG